MPELAKISDFDQTSLPRYKSHKVVKAAKIRTIDMEEDGGHWNLLMENGLTVFVSDKYVSKHDPKVGGWYIIYPDGYESWSPNEAFLSGYKRF